MGRWWTTLAFVGCLLAAGCSKHSTSDDAEPANGSVGDCYAEPSLKLVDCAENHTAETVYVSDEPVPDTSSALAPCRAAMAQFLGQDLNTRLDVRLWLATDGSWYRCDVFLRKSTQERSGFQTLTGSLKGVLREGASIDLQSCLSEPYDAAGDQVYVSCAEPHIAQELISAPAVGTIGEPFPTDIGERATRACNATASAGKELGPGRTVEAFYPKNTDAWETGERTADCWLQAVKGELPPVKAMP